MSQTQPTVLNAFIGSFEDKSNRADYVFNVIASSFISTVLIVWWSSQSVLLELIVSSASIYLGVSLFVLINGLAKEAEAKIKTHLKFAAIILTASLVVSSLFFKVSNDSLVLTIILAPLLSFVGFYLLSRKKIHEIYRKECYRLERALEDDKERKSRDEMERRRQVGEQIQSEKLRIRLEQEQKKAEHLLKKQEQARKDLLELERQTALDLNMWCKARIAELERLLSMRGIECTVDFLCAREVNTISKVITLKVCFADSKKIERGLVTRLVALHSESIGTSLFRVCEPECMDDGVMIDLVKKSVQDNDVITMSEELPSWNWDIALSNIAKECLLPVQSNAECFLPDIEPAVYFGIGQSYGGLVGGGVGSGKTNFLHTVICQTALKYSPDEVELILLDFKEGVEFDIYQNMPNVRVLITASDVTLGLSALNYLEKEIRRRAKIFKALGCTKYSDLQRSKAEPMPRWLVIIDEFQTLFHDHKIAREAEPQLDNIVRKGRAFGINFILATQSLSGVNISESTLTQLGIRVAFRMHERDAARFLSADNTIPEAFSEAGVAVYNTSHGLKNANSLVKVFPANRTLISHIVKINEKRYGLNRARFVLRGDEFAPISIQTIIKGNNSLAREEMPFHAGQLLDMSGRHYTFSFTSAMPERFLVFGYDHDKWIAILRSLTHQFASLSKDTRIFIFDFSGQIDSAELPRIENSRIVLLQDHNLISAEISRQALIREDASDFGTAANTVMCFFDIDSAREIKRSVRDKDTQIEIENPVKRDVIEAILGGPSNGNQITIFAKRAAGLEAIFKIGYESPISARLFDFQLAVQTSELNQFPEAQDLTGNTAYAIDNIAGEIQKVILFDLEKDVA
jgi:hypothetical protein